MSTIACAERIRLNHAKSFCTGGCLVQFVDQPKIVLMLSVAHGLVRREATQADLITSDDGGAFGQLRTWTTFSSSVTADVALVWVDPAKVSGDLMGLGPISATPNLTPEADLPIRFFRQGKVQKSHVTRLGQDIELTATGVDWGIPGVTYADQIVCEPMFSEPGDSGSLVIDDNNRAVGIVVAGRPYVRSGGHVVSQTIITPIGSILRHVDFDGVALRILPALPAGAVAPPI